MPLVSGSFFHLLSRGQILFLSRSEAVQLECEFYTEQFHLFDNPILWRKSQLRESTQMNMMGNMIEPFASTGRFKVIFLQEPPRYTLRLSIQSQSLSASVWLSLSFLQSSFTSGSCNARVGGRVGSIQILHYRVHCACMLNLLQSQAPPNM